MDKKQKIDYKQVGRSIVAVIDKQKYVLTSAEPATRDGLKKEIEAYNLRPSDTRLKKIIKLFTPKTEKKKTEAIVAKKVTKNKIKEVKRAALEPKKTLKKLREFFKGDKRLIVDGEGVKLAGFETVPMPKDLVSEFELYINKGINIEPLINFWMLCLLNPNPIARTKLFSYLSRHKMIITPNGYFVTYRMVKKTEKPGIYTHAHGVRNEVDRVYYEVGKASRIPRSKCDEDGSRDCSRGLHTGTPAFIGLGGLEKLGDGYVRKFTDDGYGTGYGPDRFEETFGNQAVMVLVNPSHVVSVPDSDTRKLRACELYICKEVTVDEVIKLQTNDVYVYDNNYRNFELEEIKKMLKETKLKNFVDEAQKMHVTSSKKVMEQIKELRSKLNLSGDTFNPELSFDEINRLVQSRIVKIAKTKNNPR